jgi:chemotaxis protein methyltransferase CheR
MSAGGLFEFELSDADFGRIRRLVKERSGIVLGEHKRALVFARLCRRLRELGLRRFSDYVPLVENAGGDEAVRFVNAITTNVTEFFREPHHFEALAAILPSLWQRHAQDRRVRLWSAGCSTGEEPYSLAIVLRENPPPPGTWDIKILATDLDSDVLRAGEAGIYVLEKLARLSQARLARWFDRGAGADADLVRVSPEVRALVTFKRLNLLEPWPMQGPFDLIFCRNVIIYFDDETRATLMRRFGTLLREEGHLFLGHSESLVGSADAFAPRGKNLYQKRRASRDAA